MLLQVVLVPPVLHCPKAQTTAAGAPCPQPLKLLHAQHLQLPDLQAQAPSLQAL
jgi:hypothetical protein